MVGSVGPGALPRRARAWLLTSFAVAGASLALAFLSLPRGLDGPDLALVLGGAALATSAMFFLQIRPLTLPWARERIAIQPDEAVLVAALWFLPGGAPVAIATAATLLAQAASRKPPLKASFNASTVTFAACAAWLSFEGLLALGVPRLIAIAPAPFVFTAVSQGAVALMLTLVARRPARDVLGASLAKSIVIAGGSGALLGGLTIALLGVHWLGLAIVVGLALVFHRAMAAEYRHESELAARRALHRAMDRLAGTSDEDEIVGAVYEACCEAFPLREFQVHLAQPGRAPRTWTLPASAPSQEAIAHMRVPLVSARGERVGMMTLLVADRGRRRLKDDRELAAVFAGYLAAAMGQAEALRLHAEAKQRLADVFDAAPDPILVVGPRGELAQANLAALSAFGKRVPTIGEDGVASTADGRQFEFVASPVGLDGGSFGAILLGRDVTARRRTEELLRRNERLSAMGTLVAGVAHEINNPLMYIEGHLQIALSELRQAAPDQDALRDAIEISLKGARRIEFISRGLRAVARSAPARQEPVSVNRIVEEVANLLRGGLPANVALVVDLDPTDPFVHGDPHELHQVVVNLARNAVDAVAPDGGCVTLATGAPGGAAEIVVRDDGPGVPPDARARLFTPFYTTKADGTGLGLAITHSLVQAHRGELTLESEPGEGATFRVRIPRPLLAPRNP